MKPPVHVTAIELGQCARRSFWLEQRRRVRFRPVRFFISGAAMTLSTKQAMKYSISTLALLTASFAGSCCPAARPPKARRKASTRSTPSSSSTRRTAASTICMAAFPAPTACRTSSPAAATQRDRDGSVLKELPPVWGGLTAKGVTPPVTEAQTAHLPNAPFGIDDPKGFNTAAQRHHARSVASCSTRTRCRSTAARTTSSPPSPIPAAWSWATTTAPSCRCGASPRNTCWPTISSWARSAARSSITSSSICACIPVYPNADSSPAKGLISAVNPDGVSLTLAPELAEVGARWRAEIRQQRPAHAGLLRHQHDAAAVSAERQSAAGRRRSHISPIPTSRTRWRRSTSPPSAIC